MPDFLFVATDSAGNRVQGKATAVDMSAAVRQVAAMGYALLQVEEAALPLAAQSPAPGLSNTTMQMAPQTASPPIPGQSVSAPLQQSTTQMPAMPVIQPEIAEPEKQADLLKADPAQRLKVERDLTALGMSPDEIRRLVNASATTFEADPNTAITKSGAANQLPITPTASKSKRVSESSLESFAAQLNSANAAKNNAAVREVHLDLPEFRESSTAETIQAEALLREASMLRRREKFRDAETKVREAIRLTPKDAAALELLGDILQGVGRVDEALAAYKRATEADVKRTGAERKYGELLMRQQNWNFADPEAVAPNRWLNSILSLLPGVGQMFNGDWSKAIVFFVLDLICVLMVWLSTKPESHVPRSIEYAAIALAIGSYIAALMDSNITAARKRTG